MKGSVPGNAGLLVLVAVFCAGCGSAARAPVGERSVQEASNPGSHRVVKGESLYSIAWKYGVDHQQLANWNAISSPYTIYAGQTLRTVPPRSAPPPTVIRSPLRTEPVKSVPLSKQVPKSEPVQKPAPAVTRKQDPAKGSLPPGKPDWRWPASGKLTRKFRAGGTGKKGIAIAGRRNSPVRVAADGKVVYRGSGLVGYGRLIIVKHNNNYLSAYGHNQELLVDEGDQVRAGQVIARMGSSGTNSVMLHFEIRRNGKPVDPLKLLPRR